MTDVKGKKVALIGFGMEGQSTAVFLEKNGADITVCDQRVDIFVPARYQSKLGKNYLNDLDQFDLIIPSPGVKRSLIHTQRPIVSATQLFLERCSAPVIGVTGTKGKGTTATLIAKMLASANKKVYLGGNIGKPVLDLLEKIRAEDFAVLEMSSFQLYDTAISPHIAVILMIEPDHLDWHTDMNDYVKAKTHITKFQSLEDIVIFNVKNKYSQLIANDSQGTKIPYLTEPGAFLSDGKIVIENTTICKTNEVKLIGPHNLENICAAVTTVWQIVKDNEAIAEVIKEFSGLEHRLEFVREFRGIKYYNDSFSVAPMATVAALHSFGEPIVLILGGSEKGVTYEHLAKAIARSNLRQVILIGKTAATIAKALDQANFKNYIVSQSSTMKKIVDEATSYTKKGDIVLLSPACASFDMFTDYKDRGRQFKTIVNEL